MHLFVPTTHHAYSILPGLIIWLTLHVADKSGPTGVPRPFTIPCYFVTVHYRPLLIRQKASHHGILRKVLQCYPMDVSYFEHGD